MKRTIIHYLLLFYCLFALNGVYKAAAAPVSDATEECIGCHSSIHPGIVQSWQKSRHARITPAEALKVEGRARKVSAAAVPEPLRNTAVGCAECHTLRPAAHTDTFDHNGTDVHVVVSPDDCATCHATEAEQFAENIMSHARGNLAGNAVFQDLQQTILGDPVRAEGRLTFTPSGPETRAEGCFYCHGTELKMQGLEERETVLGAMEFPRIDGWPNQGVGRINLDGSRGTCAACHTRHSFSIEMARKPYTCKECHIGPDVPAYKVYSASKHGNIQSALDSGWNYTAVPWTIGEDFTAPTCAACHISLLVSSEGVTVAERTHRMSDRIPWRIFGLIYAHPHPLDPDTTTIRNRDGLPLPTDFEGGFASADLIDAETQRQRAETMQAICRSCHSTSWVEGHWNRFEQTIMETNHKTLVATGIMKEIWNRGFAEGLDKGQSPFDESVERTWSSTWLLYANTIRFASAMAGGGDYGVFADGRYALSREIRELHDWLDLRIRLLAPPTPVNSEMPDIFAPRPVAKRQPVEQNIYHRK